MTQPLNHGGQLQQIAGQYAIPLAQWLDLSTGIAPKGYPVPQLPADVWQRLPEPSPELAMAAERYYRTRHILPVPGSQAIIQLVPTISAERGYKGSRVWLPTIGYQEHHKAWQQAGAEILLYQQLPAISALARKDIVVLINPNNPTGERIDRQALLPFYHHLSQLQGLMIIDEAFMDCTPEHSLLDQLPATNLLILRSVGKFFGLAGIRLGFVAAAPCWLQVFSHALGPWAVNGPAQAIASRALNDHQWQSQQRQYLHNQSQKLQHMLADVFKQQVHGTLLFQTLRIAKAPAIFEYLCRQGIYLRLCDDNQALRFGIPNEEQLQRLHDALLVPSISQILTKNQKI